MIGIRPAVDLVAACAFIARTLPFDVNGAGGQVGDLVAGCSVFELVDGGQVVGAFAARSDDYSDGRVLSITAAGGLPGYDLTAAMDAWMTLQGAAAGARRLQCHTKRRGLIKKLMAAGYHVAGVVMAKDL